MKVSCIGFLPKITNITQKTPQKLAFKGTYDTFSLNQADAEFKANFSAELDSKKDELYDFLDSLEIKNFQGLKDGSIVNILAQFFDSTPEYKEFSDLMHKTSRENTSRIIKNGFDEMKIGSTKFGPAIYFGTNEGSLEIYRGEIMLADFKGNYAEANSNIEKSDYLSGDLASKTMEYLKIDTSSYSPELAMKFQVLEGFIKQYMREKIVNELKIDGAFAKSSKDGYFLVFNPKTIENIRTRS